MRVAIPGLTFLTAALIAAAPAPKPVLTIEGLNASLVKVIALHSEYDAATPTQREKLGQDIMAVHKKCLEWHDAIAKTLTPEQLKAFYTYAHEQMKAAGIEHGQITLLMPKGADDHAAMHGAGHGG
jgi:hypothetical protein